MKYIKPLLLLLVVVICSYSVNTYAKYMDATIINKDTEYIEIITSNDSIYKIKYTNDKFNTGDSIRITYSNYLNSLKEIQDIKITDISKTELNTNYDKNVIKTLNNMTLEEKVGQLLLVRTPDIYQLDTIRQYKIGGYILFKRDIDNKTKQDLINYINSFQAITKIPLLIAIDEEGGDVTRLSYNKNIVDTPFLSPQDLYNQGGFDRIKEDAINKTNLLEELGINVNLAPVADMVTDTNSYMYDRSFGSSIVDTSRYIKTILSTQKPEVSYVLKHFPGYGDNSDTHENITVDNRSYKELKYRDFIPFMTGINTGANAVLVSHNVVTSIEDKPASISRNMHNILRNTLNFDGVIMTDDLSMNGIKDYSTNTPYIDAILAGNNILIVSDYEDAYNEILNGIREGKISEELINRLVLKDLEFKQKKNLKSEFYCPLK